MALDPQQKAEALQRATWIVEPLMPAWCEISQKPADCSLRVEVVLHGAQNKLGREIHVRFGERGLERYAAMSGEHRHAADTAVRTSIEKQMRHYDDGHAARRGVVLDPLVIELNDVLASD